MTNQELMRKADWVVTDLASGGQLNPEQAAAFIRKLILQPTLLQNVRTVTMNSPQRNINKIQFATRILRQAAYRLRRISIRKIAISRWSSRITRSIPTWMCLPTWPLG